MMTLRFSRAEYWLLEIAVDQALPLPDLLRPHLAESLNRSSHDCSADELAEALERLFCDHYITSFRSPIPPTGKRRIYRRLARADIDSELRRPLLPPDPDDPFHLGSRHPDETYYRLTPTGGAAWESFARPDWNLFIDGVGTCLDLGSEAAPHPARGYAICPALWKLQRYVATARHIGHHIDEASIGYDTLSPWKATYWKTLPSAHRVRYKMMYHDAYAENHGWPPLSHEVFGLARNWYRWRS